MILCLRDPAGSRGRLIPEAAAIGESEARSALGGTDPDTPQAPDSTRPKTDSVRLRLIVQPTVRGGARARSRSAERRMIGTPDPGRAGSTSDHASAAGLRCATDDLEHAFELPHPADAPAALRTSPCAPDSEALLDDCALRPLRVCRIANALQLIE
jgi:hypothetical protein